MSTEAERKTKKNLPLIERSAVQTTTQPSAPRLHTPVMVTETIAHLVSKRGGVYVDGTFGLGGHTQAILKEDPQARVIAFDWCQEQLQMINKKDFGASSSFTLINDNYVNFKKHLTTLGVEQIDGFLLDLGPSSYQLDSASFGMSYRSNSPLDMRFSQENDLTAAQVVNHLEVERLVEIFRELGEERYARSIAKKIDKKRKTHPITTTEELVEAIAAAFPFKTKKHPARRVFQALRIYINKELENLIEVLEKVLKTGVLAPGGRVVVLSYHSLEDRVVKRLFRKQVKGGGFRLLTPKPLLPTPEELRVNRRSRSAKLRVLERTA